MDVLNLSATPIPRTLNMAMSGIRDMSVIEEAPQDRHPVQTYVLEYDREILAAAIRRELRRADRYSTSTTGWRALTPVPGRSLKWRRMPGSSPLMEK